MPDGDKTFSGSIVFGFENFLMTSSDGRRKSAIGLQYLLVYQTRCNHMIRLSKYKTPETEQLL